MSGEGKHGHGREDNGRERRQWAEAGVAIKRFREEELPPVFVWQDHDFIKAPDRRVDVW